MSNPEPTLSEYIIRLRHWVDTSEKSLSCLLWLSGAFGLILGSNGAFGILGESWEAAISTAQVLNGLVRFPAGSLGYDYHASVFSITNYIACLFLAITDSETASSVLLSALLGLLAMQALAMSLFVVIRNAFLATLIATLLGIINYPGAGIHYPIIFVGTGHTYAKAGLAFALYAVLLIGLSRFRLGFFLCGLALSLHPSWGLWLNACLILTLCIRFKSFQAIFTRDNIACYAAGIAISVGLYAWHRNAFPITQTALLIDPAEVRNLFLYYIRYWDGHRYADLTAGALAKALPAALLTLALLKLILKKTPSRSSENLLFSFLLCSSALSVLLVFVPYLDAGVFPEFFIAVMPGRFINLAIFLCIPLAAAYLILSLDSGNQRAVLQAAVLGGLAIVITAWDMTIRMMMVSGAALGVGVIAIMRRRQMENSLSIDQFRLRNYVVCAFLAALAAFLTAYAAYKLSAMKEQNHGITITRPVHGSILTTVETAYAQISTRTATITPYLDGFPYVGGFSLVALNELVNDIYGVSIKSIPSADLDLHGGEISTKDYETLWTSRSCSDWVTLAKKYGFGLIVVPPQILLQLQRYDDDPAWNKYVPSCQP